MICVAPIFLWRTESIRSRAAYNDNGIVRRIFCFFCRHDLREAFSSRSCMKVRGMGNTFSAERSTVEGRRSICFGIAEKNQECEFSVQIRRGDIYYADLSPVVGSEQGGLRPVLIIQNDVGNRYSPTVIAAAITSQLTKAKLPTHIDVYADRFGLAKDSVILLEQIRTIDKRRLKEKMGHLDDSIMQRVNEAISVSIGLGGDRMHAGQRGGDRPNPAVAAADTVAASAAVVPPDTGGGK